MTHVLLDVRLAARRADAAAVLVEAVEKKIAVGWGHRQLSCCMGRLSLVGAARRPSTKKSREAWVLTHPLTIPQWSPVPATNNTWRNGIQLIDTTADSRPARS